MEEVKSVVALPKDHISYSQINMFLRCPKQYYYRYVEDLIRPPKWVMVAGKSGHRAMEFNNRHKMKTGENEKKHDVLDYFEACWIEEKDLYEEIVYGNIKPNEVVPLMIQPINRYFDKGTFINDIPIGVEKEFALNFEGIDTTVVGFIDLIFPGQIWDYKFSQKKPGVTQLANANQLSMYAISQFIENKVFPDKLGYAYLISTKEPQVNLYEIPNIKSFVRNFMENLKDSIITISNAMSTGTFIRNDTGFMCTPESCGYYDICKPGMKKIYYDLQTAYGPKKKG